MKRSERRQPRKIIFVQNHGMDINGIAVATITWARDEREESLMRASLKRLAGLKIPVFVCDGGSGAGFLQFLHGFAQFRVVPRVAAGLFWQVKSSLDAAYAGGSPFILYTEPDKLDFFTLHLSDFITMASGNNETGIWLAERLPEAFHSFPGFQQFTETTINDCCAELVSNKFDFSYGPFLMNRELVPQLSSVKEDIGWGWRLFMFVIAKRMGLKIDGMKGAYTCPVAQREDDASERIYRMKQLSQSINGMITAAAVKLV